MSPRPDHETTMYRHSPYTCSGTCRRYANCCILPPEVLRNIAQNGTPQQRDTAMETMASDHTFRLMRATLGVAGVSMSPPLGIPADAQKARTIYDAQHAQQLPGIILRNEGGNMTGDVAADEAYAGLGATFDFYWNAYERNSIDDQGLHLNASVHYGKSYDNAFWNGTQMVFGDGDGDLFNRFTISLDVIGHELTHGVTQDEANLAYLGQSGALNESLSDVFGSLVKQFTLKQTADQADWLIGAELFTPKVKGIALRSMKAPGTAFDDPVLGKDSQPAHMKDYVHTIRDNGGVHTNSGIPNHAFYLAAVAIGGNAWEKTGRIWYETVRDPRLKPPSGFKTFARLTAANARRLFGTNSAEQKAVHDAWNQVGIKTN